MDYSAQIEYSSDMNANYSMVINKMGVNHLICLGSGELRNRTVVHLYVDGNGNISQTQTFTGLEERAEVLDELADVLTYCCFMADALDADVEEIILNKLEKTAKKYPVKKAKGVSTKYDKL